jgi:hypothetical protein
VSTASHGRHIQSPSGEDGEDGGGEGRAGGDSEGEGGGAVAGDEASGGLPFTGFPAAAAALAGGTMAALGAAIRRATRADGEYDPPA